MMIVQVKFEMLSMKLVHRRHTRIGNVYVSEQIPHHMPVLGLDQSIIVIESCTRLGLLDEDLLLRSKFINVGGHGRKEFEHLLKSIFKLIFTKWESDLFIKK